MLRPDPVTPPPHPALLLTPEEAARVLRIGRTRLYALLADATLPSFRIGHSRRIVVSALHDYVDRLDDATVPAAVCQPAGEAPPPVPPLREGRRARPRRSASRTAPTSAAVEVLALPFPVEPLESAERYRRTRLVPDARETT